MAGSFRSCCVSNCGKTRIDNVVLHAFPDPRKETERFKMWVNAVGSSVSTLDNQFIFRNRKICHNHFEEKYLTWTRKLAFGAVPTLHLPGSQAERLVWRDITNIVSNDVKGPVPSTSKNYSKETNLEPLIASTSSANKLVTVTLNRVEFEKVKWLRTRYVDEKLKAVKTLRYILNQQVKNKTCRLCLKPGDKRIFDGVHEFDLVNNIKNILGIELTKDESKPQHICSFCESVVSAAAELKVTAETTQWRLQQEFEMVADSTSDNYVVESEKRHGGYFNINGQDMVREWTCGKCKRTFQNNEDFTEHEQLPTCRAKTRTFICETCGAEFKTMPRLKRHRQIHTGELRYSCSQCPYRARTRCALLIHERRHSGSKPLRCPFCPATFASPSNLGSHRKTHLPPAFQCETCQRGFKFKVNLMNHIATQHRSAKPYNCNTCGKSFATRKLIRHHELKTHNRPKMRTGQLPVYMQLQDNIT